MLKHIEVEWPGTLMDFFSQTSWATEVIELSQGQKLPSLEKVSAIISLGGPMNVYEEEKYPFLKQEDEFLRNAMQGGIPILGICLGAQLLAKACGAKVAKNVVSEIGWYTVSSTPEARADLLFKGFNGSLEVFQWHEDTFEVPGEGILLATGKECKNQAFRVGENAWGLQFHPEMTVEMLLDWLDYYPDKLDRGKVLREFQVIKDRYRWQADSLCLNFARAIERYEKARNFFRINNN